MLKVINLTIQALFELFLFVFILSGILILAPFGLLLRKIPRMIFSDFIIRILNFAFMPLYFVMDTSSKFFINLSDKMVLTNSLLQKYQLAKKGNKNGI